jgi:phospholipid/cholesterol/gamma-HCH transport system permease protein
MSTAEHAVGWFAAWLRAMRFALVLAAAAISRKTYTPYTRDLALKQIYFTAWHVAVGFTLFSALLSLVVIRIVFSAAVEYGLGSYALELVFRVLILELLPLGTAVFVAIRSGSAISTEVALMQIDGRLDAIQAQGFDPLQREFVPRVAAAAVSVFSLTMFTCTVAVVLAYISLYGFSPWGMDEFSWTVALVFGPAALLGFLLKCLVFGIVVAIIPIAAGIHATPGDYNSAPVAVMGGMVRLVLTLALVEVLSLAVKYV